MRQKRWIKATVTLLLLVGLVGASVVQAQEMPGQQMKQMIQKLQAMTQADGYLQAHRGVQEPLELLGGPVQFSITQSSGGVFVALPDHRQLDSRVMGTADMPLALTGTPGITGVPRPSVRWRMARTRG